MKTQILKTAIAIIFAINFNVNYVNSQTALSGTGENTCGAGNAGTDNTFVGCAAGAAIQSGGNYNSALGENALNSITTGDDNVGIGFEAGEGTTTGARNSYLGYRAGYNVTLATDNTFIGYAAGFSDRTGNDNTVVGKDAGYYLQDDDYNTYMGRDAGKGTTAYAAEYNTFIGYKSGQVITTGIRNTFTGSHSGYSHTTGDWNSFFGYNTGVNSTTGDLNTFMGYYAGYYNATGGENTCIGAEAGNGVSGNSYSNNTYIGRHSGYATTTGSNNTAVGHSAGDFNATIANCTFLGYNTDATGNHSNSMALGNGASTNASNDIVLGNASIQTLRCNATLTGLSDRRVKDNIQENVVGLDFIKLLRPVTFHYNIDHINEITFGPEITQYDSLGNEIQSPLDVPGKYNREAEQVTGFIAQEVDSIADIVGYDFSGVYKPEDETSTLWGLRYSDFVVPMVKAIQEQQAQIEELKNEIRQCCSAPSNKMEEETSNTIKNDNATLVDLKYTDGVVLYQNIPNPFGEETTINFYLPQTVKAAKMVFYDNMGKMIKEVILSQKGNASIIVKSSELASGVYSYSLVVDETIVATKTMIKNK
jgi:hypothetical protein